MSVRAAIHKMLVLQDQVNIKVHPQWKTQKFPYYRAAWIECGELMSHLNWSWWKKVTPNILQAQLEAVDVWHFGLSMLILEGWDFENLANIITASYNNHTYMTTDPLDATEAVVTSLIKRHFPLTAFWTLLKSLDMTFDQLYSLYVGKNVLNNFRQDNGYGNGKYTKMWHGREDNEHLSEIVKDLDSGSDTFMKDIYVGLQKKYDYVMCTVR